MRLSLLLAFSCAKPPTLPAAVPVDSPPTYRATLALEGDKWRVSYRFSEPQTALLFDTSHGDYREATWAPQATVSIKNHGGLDGMFFDRPASEATFLITPPPAPTDGTPAFLNFSDGTTAFYTGQLALLTIQSEEAAIELNGNLRNWKGQQPPVEVSFIGDDPPFGSRSSVAQFGRGPYLYAGAIRPKGQVLVDPGLPAWISIAFSEQLNAVADTISSAWAQDVPHSALLAWGGYGAFQNRGRAEGHQISMRIQGDRYREANDQAMDDLVWFFAHEITHLHQFHNRGDSSTWAVEGFADTLATRTLLDLGRYERDEVDRRYARVAWECGAKLKGRVAKARGRTAYVCGDIVGLAITALLPDHDLVAAWKQARTSAGGGFGLDGLLSTLGERGVQAEKLEAIRSFVTLEHADPSSALRELLESSGLEPVYAEGTLQTLHTPY